MKDVTKQPGSSSCVSGKVPIASDYRILPPLSDNAQFSDIAHEQNFRYSYLEEKSVQAARCPVG